MNLTVERHPGVSPRFEDEVLHQHPEITGGRLTLRPNTSTARPAIIGSWLPSDIPEGADVEFSPRTLKGSFEGWKYEICVWQRRRGGQDVSSDYRGVPIKQTPEQKAQYDRTMRAVYGSRVKIPPLGPEFDALVERILRKVSAHGTQGWNMTDFHVKDVLDVLAEEEG